MKKMLVALASCLVLTAFVPVAQARPNYRPWKHALVRAWDTYGLQYWNPEPGVDYVGRIVTIYPPDGFRWDVNRWDVPTRVLATEVTAFYGVVPNGEWGPDIRAFLTPFLNRNPDPSTYPVPWIVDILVTQPTPGPTPSPGVTVSPQPITMK